MRYPLVALVALSLMSPMVMVGPVSAETLQDALAAAYTNNPALDAARARLRAIDERVAQARGGWRPTVEATGSIGRTNTQTEGITQSVPPVAYNRDDTYTSKTASVALVQPVFSGFRTVNDVKQAKNEIYAGREDLRNTEQSILLDAITAYVNVKRDEAVLELNRNNVQVLQRQLEASQDRFRVGEITRTDVAQSEARLALAMADRTTAEAQLTASRAFYRRVIGETPGSLAEPGIVPELPLTEDAAIELAMSDNPNLNSARYNERATENAIGVAKSGLLPQINLRAQYSKGWDVSPFTPANEEKSIVAELRIPLYEAGIQSSLVRQARQTNNQYRLLIVDVERQVQEGVRNAWESLRSARDRVKSDESQVRANEIALDGVRQEAEVGARTTLDVLDAEQELLNARVALVRDKRDEVVAGYALLASVGHLTGDRLELPVTYYDPIRNYDRVSNKVWGWGIEDEPSE